MAVFFNQGQENPMKKIKIIILTTVVICSLYPDILFPAPNTTDRRVALVIGNAHYEFGALNCPENDANDIAGALTSLGFEVLPPCIDADKKEMQEAVELFKRKLAGAQTGLFYYSGHGMQFNGKNYLLPVGASKSMKIPAHVEYEGVPVGYVQAVMNHAGTKTNFLFLDACRNLPYSLVHSQNQGLGAFERGINGMFIGYATSPNSVAFDNPKGRNSVFTGSLKKHLVLPGKNIFEIMTLVNKDVAKETNNYQKPEMVANLDEMFVFTPGENSDDNTPAVFTNAVGMQFVRISPGSFTMGSPPDEPGRDSDEKQHPVTLSKGFHMQIKEVTVDQWRRFIRESGYATEAETSGGAWIWTGGEWKKKEGYYWDHPGFEQTGEHPVTCVSWNDVQRFIQWLNQKTGQAYSLPTEAQWEYAARAGSSTAFANGKITDTGCSDKNMDAMGWYCGNAGGKTHLVGRKQKNDWGLYDMHGNVWEWCSDRYGNYPGGSVTDPVGSPDGSSRVIRGGSWDYRARYCRSAYRGRGWPGNRYSDLGFRLVLPPGQ